MRNKTITNDSRLLSTVMMGTNIVQSFNFELTLTAFAFYRGWQYLVTSKVQH
ncbi:hypothetical protein O9992_14520 [Vibrio lentus]|nr:hypothetical protein [Vibrio lentus]